MATVGTDLTRPVYIGEFLTIWWRLGLSTFLAGQGMLLGLAINLSEANRDERFVLHCVVGATALGVVFLLGWPLLRTAGKALLERQVTVELLFLTAVGGALGASIQSTITGEGPIYFEVVSILLVVYSFSKTMIAIQRASALQATQGWMSRLRQARLRDRTGRARWVPAKTIQRDDVIEVQPGEWVPVDGVVQRGTAFVRDTPMTGEPFPRVLRAGDSVLAGFAVEDATLLVRATASGSQRRIDQLLSIVDQARGTTSSLQRHADRWANLFLPIVLSIGTGTFVVWTAIAGWPTALMNAMAVLLVACPCAAGLATPLAVWSTLTLLASRGLVIREANLIDALASVDHVVFDKTGTLTEDASFVVDVATRATGQNRARIMSWIAAVESRSRHPIARALASVPVPAAEDTISNVEMTTREGNGIEALFEDACGTQHHIRLGRPEWVRSFLVRPTSAADHQLLRSSPACLEASQIDVAIDGELEAVCLVREKVRETASDAIAELQRHGLRVSILTGDNKKNSDAAGLRNVMCDLSPEDKACAIEAWQERGARCLYVGDGINDAPAMCAAHAAVALQSGTEVACAAAPGVLCHENLCMIPFALKACLRAVRTLKLNLILSAVYNTVGMSMAASGLLHPVVAALLMVGSSLLVAFRSLRLCEA